MDRLEAGAGEAINRYATETGVHLVPYNETSTGEQSATLKIWHHRLKGGVAQYDSYTGYALSGWAVEWPADDLAVSFLRRLLTRVRTANLGASICPNIPERLHRTPFVPYYRVSTDRQGRRGLGLEAQYGRPGLLLRSRCCNRAEFFFAPQYVHANSQGHFDK